MIHKSKPDFFKDHPINIGDRIAFKNLFKQYYAAFCFFAERLTNSPDDAEDIVEDVFYKLWQRNDWFESEQHFKAFMYRSIKNACLDFVKLNERRERRNNFFTEEQGYKQESYLNEIIRAEVIREVYAAIESLPPQCGKVITMSFVEGKSNREIAEELNLSMQTVKNQKGRGLALLKTMMSHDKFQVLLLLPYLSIFDLLHNVNNLF
ncbi:MAG TPA: RNA polymerase sigma-70 factor [Mucilaginibacter sp.]|nr:RNA polymerase sigma-70 factor [Mucilaginibacter sp.]